MPYPFNRADEHSPRTPGSTPGVRVSLGGRQYWFPGSTVELATILARTALPESILNHPETVVEFGTRDGAVFVLEQEIKTPPPKGGV